MSEPSSPEREALANVWHVATERAAKIAENWFENNEAANIVKRANDQASGHEIAKAIRADGAALTPRAVEKAGEPVAWRWRNELGPKDFWTYSGTKPDPHPQYITEPLYTTRMCLPKGYVLVPIVPTQAMIEAGCDNNPTQWNEGTDLGFAADVANDVYVAMVRTAIGTSIPEGADVRPDSQEDQP